MADVIHRAIIVTSAHPTATAQARRMAAVIFNGKVSDVVVSELNGYISFIIPSCGSKEDLPPDRAHQERIDCFVSWVRGRSETEHELEWAEVVYGSALGKRVGAQGEPEAAYVRRSGDE